MLYKITLKINTELKLAGCLAVVYRFNKTTVKYIFDQSQHAHHFLNLTEKYISYGMEYVHVVWNSHTFNNSVANISCFKAYFLKGNEIVLVF